MLMKVHGSTTADACCHPVPGSDGRARSRPNRSRGTSRQWRRNSVGSPISRASRSTRAGFTSRAHSIVVVLGCRLDHVLSLDRKFCHSRRGHGDLARRHHSSRGSRYASEQFWRLLAHHGITGGVGRASHVWGNSAREILLASRKVERANCGVRTSLNHVQADGLACVERFHNARRRYEKLGYLRLANCQQAMDSTQHCVNEGRAMSIRGICAGAGAFASGSRCGSRAGASNIGRCLAKSLR